MKENFHLTDENARGCVTERGASEDLRNEVFKGVRVTIADFEDVLDEVCDAASGPEVGSFALTDG